MIELTCIIYFIFIIYNFDKLYRFNSIKLRGLVMYIVNFTRITDKKKTLQMNK